MKKSTNGTVLAPPGIIEKEITKSRKYDRAFEPNKSTVIVKNNILKDKELLFMSSISVIWFIAFFYCLLFVFT